MLKRYWKLALKFAFRVICLYWWNYMTKRSVQCGRHTQKSKIYGEGLPYSIFGHIYKYYMTATYDNCKLSTFLKNIWQISCHILFCHIFLDIFIYMTATLHTSFGHIQFLSYIWHIQNMSYIWQIAYSVASPLEFSYRNSKTWFCNEQTILYFIRIK